jgi:hypothetical protein
MAHNLKRTADVELQAKQAQTLFLNIQAGLNNIQAMNQQVAAAASEQEAVVNQHHQNIGLVSTTASNCKSRIAEAKRHSEELVQIKVGLQTAITDLLCSVGAFLPASVCSGVAISCCADDVSRASPFQTYEGELELSTRWFEYFI